MNEDNTKVGDESEEYKKGYKAGIAMTASYRTGYQIGVKDGEAGAIERAIELKEAYESYIKLLGDEINEMSGLCVVHGWSSSRAEVGADARKRISECLEKNKL